MTQFCGCLGSAKPEPRTQIPAYPDAGFMPRPETQMAMHMHMHMQHQPPQYDAVANGYAPVVPLPRYTPRPMSIHEKTLENNIGWSQHSPDEKSRQGFALEDEHVAALNSQSTGSSSVTVTGTTMTTAQTTIMDDASSAYSFPSSFGHTSTETRDTPPPPYSSCGSSFHTRSRASSVRSQRRSESLFNYSLNGNGDQGMAPEAAVIAPPPMAHVQMYHNHQHQHQRFHSASMNAHRHSISRSITPNQRRPSWESQ